MVLRAAGALASGREAVFLSLTGDFFNFSPDIVIVRLYLALYSAFFCHSLQLYSILSYKTGNTAVGIPHFSHTLRIVFATINDRAQA
jgi:hypothetical protein